MPIVGPFTNALVLVNGAYGKRFARLTEMMGRRLSTFETADDVPTTGADVARALDADPSISHVGLIHCETSTGILNPLPEIADAVAKRGRHLIVDAMSSFGAMPIDARSTPWHRHRRVREAARAPSEKAQLAFRASSSSPRRTSRRR